MRKTTDGDLCNVRTIKGDMVILQTVSVPCRANTGSVERKMPVLFEPDMEQLPSGLQISDTLLSISRGTSSRINTSVSNTTCHDIILNKRTVLGRLQLVKSVTLLEVKYRDQEIFKQPTATWNSAPESIRKGTTTQNLPSGKERQTTRGY